MSESDAVSLPEAARRFGVPINVLRRAIRAGTLPAAPGLSATAGLTGEWVARAKAATEQPGFSWARKQKVPAFARYEGTSCWRKYRVRVREFYAHKARTGQILPE